MHLEQILISNFIVVMEKLLTHGKSLCIGGKIGNFGV
jgi:hypothetical protein